MAVARLFIVLGAVGGFLAVALGAFAAHGLQDMLAPQRLVTWHTGNDYLALHALAVIGVGLAITQFGDTGMLRAAGWSFVLGVALFSGSLFALALTDIRWLGAITPFGGTAFLAGWALFAWRIARGTR